MVTSFPILGSSQDSRFEYFYPAPLIYAKSPPIQGLNRLCLYQSDTCIVDNIAIAFKVNRKEKQGQKPFVPDVVINDVIN